MSMDELREDQVSTVDPGIILTEFAELIKLLLRCFATRELRRLSRVCKQWLFYAEKILTARRYDVTWLLAEKQSKSNWVAMADLPEVASFVKGLNAEVEFAFVCGKLPLSRECYGGNDLLYLKSLLSPQCTAVAVVCNAGIIGSVTSTCACREIQSPKLECFSALFFPKIDGLEMFYFNLQYAQLNKLGLLESDKNIHLLATNPQEYTTVFGMPFEKKVKCLLLVAPSYMEFDYAQKIYEVFWRKQHGQVTLCGGISEDLWLAKPHAREIEDLNLMGLAFCGDSVHVATVILHADVRSRKQAEQCLQRLRAQTEPVRARAKQRFAFMFTCAGRGTHVYNRQDVETGLFQEHFPGVPLCGIFSLGECGTEGIVPLSTNASDDGAASDWNERSPNVLFGYTTVFALITVC